MTSKATVRPASAEDRDAFLALWEQFVASQPDEAGDRQMGATNWARILDPDCALGCLLALDEAGRLVGFQLHLAFPFTWSQRDACYLQDLFVTEAARGRGHARALIEALAALGRERGWFKIFWMTQHDNLTAQRLYDKVAVKCDYIRYDLAISGS
ncbi:MAG: GNAT family N-acetyltransferase [Rhodospirillales bacterium]